MVISLKALILCGGKGKRLRPLTDNVPKPLLNLGGKPILEWQMLLLMKHGIRNIILATGYLGEKIKEYFRDGSDLGVKIEYQQEDPENPLGTAGPIKAAVDRLSDVFVVLNGDILTTMNILRLLRVHRETNASVTISLVKLRSPYGIIETNGYLVTKFVEKPFLPYYINAGVYVFNKEIVNLFPSVGMLETDVFPALIREKIVIAGCKFDEGTYWKDIGNVKDFEEAGREIDRIKAFLGMS